MQFKSTRSPEQKGVLIHEALRKGLAPDGGLFVPEVIPPFSGDLETGGRSFAAAALQILRPFFKEDPLLPRLESICQRALHFPVPLRFLDEETGLLELFHGPTSAFKDIGARFLAECLTELDSVAPDLQGGGQHGGGRRSLLVATSGDTGGAVAAAFAPTPIEVGILFPQGRVSPRQQKQLTTWGGRIHSFAVRGNFDDCQRLVKAAFQNPHWPAREGLTSANSINVGRLLPQIVPFALASTQYFKERGVAPGIIIPSGNLGNAVGAFYAQAMGFPISKIGLATNANRTIVDYFTTGTWQPRPSISTWANAMDVGSPSNIERLTQESLSAFRKKAFAQSVSDLEIQETLRRVYQDFGEIICPHTATAFHVRHQRPGHWIVTATAHPAKFETLVEPLLRPLMKASGITSIPLPPTLREILERPESFTEIEPTETAFFEAWSKVFLLRSGPLH